MAEEISSNHQANINPEVRFQKTADYVGTAALSAERGKPNTGKVKKFIYGISGFAASTLIGYFGGVIAAPTAEDSFKDKFANDCLAGTPYDITSSSSQAEATVRHGDLSGAESWFTVETPEGVLSFETPGYNRMAPWPFATAPELIVKDSDTRTIKILENYACQFITQSDQIPGQNK